MIPGRNTILPLPILFTALFLAAAPLHAQVRLSGESMGTTWQVTINGQAPANTRQTIQDELDLVDRLMSTWREDSEVSRFNASQSSDWFPVSPETYFVVRAAQTVSEATEGAFDVTVSPLIAMWNFDKNVNRNQVPSDSDIETVKADIGWQQLSLRADPPALRKANPKLSINLSAIAKGYAVDRVADAISGAGAESFLVEVGGEVRAAGSSPRGGPWKIGVEEPVEGERRIFGTLELQNTAMATSGDYRNFYVVEGKRYSHTIDPRTGRPIEHGLASASVLAESCMLADAWATALSVLGPAESVPVIERYDLAAGLIARTDNGFAESLYGRFPLEPATESQTAEQTPEPRTAAMWPVFLAAAIVFLLAVGGMAIGVIISNKRLKGSCGGLAGMTDEAGKTACEMCTVPSAECRGENSQAAPAGPEAAVASDNSAAD